ncbi:MAG: flagellar type III secretion system pore protein FliP [Mariniblastus sp.]|nr:flagellar type III secretion system pore protein FliP [Mariniblastus sp.]
MHILRITIGLFRVGVAILIACLVIASGSAFAQQLDSNGWSDFETGLVANQPATLESDLTGSDFAPQASPASDLMTAEIRHQIGLASFEDPVSVESAPKTQTEGAAAFSQLISSQTEQLTSRDGIGSSLKVALLLATLSLAPAIILMTTCYIRVIVVLTLLKQAFGAQQLPPTQVLTALALFVTLLVMTPVWNQVKTDAIDPYTAENGISWNEAWERGVIPVKNFMATQIESAGNGESIAMFYRYLPDHQTLSPPSSPKEVPLNVLLPAFVVSELKVAFLLGFQIYLPFLVLDLVVSSVTVSTGMLMLPPTMVSFPLKLILFVMVDGWNLVIGMLLQSFGVLT